MTATQLAQKKEKAEILRVFQIRETEYYVENSAGKICYRVTIDNGSKSCTCGDFVANIQKDPEFICKHIFAALNANGSAQKVENTGNGKPRLDERFIMAIEGSEFVKYPGLLDLAHQKGITKIEVEPLQYPTKENEYFAICKALVVSKNNETFTDVGDANPTNCNKRVVKHLLRMASTRAIARALRSYTNIGMTCLEELADFDDVTEGKDKPKVRREPLKSVKPPMEAVTDAKATGKATGEKKNPDAQAPEKGPEESLSGKKEHSEGATPKSSKAQLAAIETIAIRRGIPTVELDEMVQKEFGTSLTNITSTEAARFIRSLQQSA